VLTNSWGETTLPGLFAVGEVACTGVHGANRLASNSLLETVVFAKRAVERLLEPPDPPPPPPSPSDDARPLPTRDGCEGECGAPEPAALRELMWTHVGIVRDGHGLAEAAEGLAGWEALLPPMTDRAATELRSMVVCGRLATEAALMREESRGAHYRSDFPEPREEWRRHIVFRADPK